MTMAARSSRLGAEHRRYLLVLGVIFGVVWLALAIDPWYREGWALENVLVVAFVVFVALSYKRLTLSRISYTLIFLFLCLHEIGAHYTYAETPYDEWFRALTGRTLNSLLGWERNNFDRVVHFAYGLLLAYPVREIFLRVAAVRGFWGYFLPLDLTMSTSMIFELFEWAAAEAFGGDLGTAYLGTQGDVWDAHKDMALASCGALIAMLVTYGINRALQRDFASEWAESLRVKIAQPLGEDAIARMLDNRDPKR
jgi:putative membrane protein